MVGRKSRRDPILRAPAVLITAKAFPPKLVDIKPACNDGLMYSRDNVLNFKSGYRFEERKKEKNFQNFR